MAGITINLTLGENGIITRAQQAGRNYTNAQDRELAEIDNADNEIEKILGEIPSQMVVAGERASKTEKNNYTDGTNKATIPAGFTVSGISTEQTIADGLVIYDIPKEELASINWNKDEDADGVPDVQTKYNQFVWIPCTIDGANGSIKYDRYAFTREDWTYAQTIGEYDSESNSYKIIRVDDTSNYFIETMSSDEEKSISTYKGYYIGRYEAGIASETGRNSLDKDTLATAEVLESNWGKTLSQKEKNIYNWVTRDQAKGLAENMYTSGITSNLCSSYAWDTALKFIETKNSAYITNGSTGNYSGTLSKTGYNATDTCNIYDMGGNVQEWTTEVSSINDKPCVGRGGYYTGSSSSLPASYRSCSSSENANAGISFRVILYL